MFNHLVVTCGNTGATYSALPMAQISQGLFQYIDVKKRGEVGQVVLAQHLGKLEHKLCKHNDVSNALWHVCDMCW